MINTINNPHRMSGHNGSAPPNLFVRPLDVRQHTVYFQARRDQAANALDLASQRLPQG
jgi:hypothetical protein